ncbi:PLDc N-terminal domain-containing protein [Algiphilus sp.]|uniref:PLDc N-terminal domain-containing protein n=1 Tax=Algiphilus sp. TaxID=1872431 RepID=UPI003C415FE3
MEPFTGVLGILLLVAVIWAILRIVGSRAGPLSKAIWIVLIIVLPVIGLLIWLIFGPKS